jgi:hypothetical protein
VIALETQKQELFGAPPPAGGGEEPGGGQAAVGPPHFPNLPLPRDLLPGVEPVHRAGRWVSTRVDGDTVEFAVESLRRWWRQVGCRVTPQATELLVVADAGDGLGSRDRLWVAALQRLANELQLRLSMNHFPPGTSRWSAVTHRMLCHTTTSRPGSHPVSHAVAVNLIGQPAATTPQPVAIEVAPGKDRPEAHGGKDEVKAVRIERAALHGEWNFTISPYS